MSSGRQEKPQLGIEISSLASSSEESIKTEQFLCSQKLLTLVLPALGPRGQELHQHQLKTKPSKEKKGNFLFREVILWKKRVLDCPPLGNSFRNPATVRSPSSMKRPCPYLKDNRVPTKPASMANYVGEPPRHQLNGAFRWLQMVNLVCHLG